MSDLDNLQRIIRDLSKEMEIDTLLIEVYVDDDGLYAIDINAEDWSNCLTSNEALDVITNLFRGIALGKHKEWRY